MDKVIRLKVSKFVGPRCSALWNTMRDFVNEWVGFEEVQDHITEVAEEIWNEAIETAAQEADTNGDFATSNAIRTYKIDKTVFLEVLYE